MELTRSRALLAALAAVGCWAWSATAVSQSEAVPSRFDAPTVPAIPAVPANPNIPSAAMDAAQSIQNQLNARAGSATEAMQQGRSAVLLGSGVEAAAPRPGGFMQPTFKPLAVPPIDLPRMGGTGIHGNRSPPGSFTFYGSGPPTVKGLYTAPNEQDPLNRITP